MDGVYLKNQGSVIFGRDIKERGRDLAGGFFREHSMLTDASAGTLLGAVGCYLMGMCLRAVLWQALPSI